MDISTIIAIASLGTNIIIGAVFITVSLRRRDPIDETLQDYATDAQLTQVRNEMRCELHNCRAERAGACQLEHGKVNVILADLYRENKAMLEKLTDKQDDLKTALSAWQNGIERQLGSLDSRTNNIEKEQRKL